MVNSSGSLKIVDGTTSPNSPRTILDNQATSGFSYDGTKCDEFDVANGNDLCPFKVEAIAKPICTGNCINPTYEIKFSLNYKPKKSSFIINEKKFELKIYKDPYVDSIEATCLSLGGQMLNGYCEFNLFSGVCIEQGKFLVGLNKGSPICESFPTNTLCPVGEYIKNFDVSTGAAQCVKI